ncbi:hypothetical protein GS399_13350 [Pedobacter sp. HMF7647]|uniref:Putative beta-lactamase-inhibitor-like PepSY-like domain-containing protein n=1 Tax=Hufsiella arboris TaxID=2695275 RepID=A0A7K1YBK9_9SPHI|nr:PepSY-like domain-containing protein [Hufsiella arboris]MXV51963.1 hypothetical protein [Hufsiella arboris]
MNIFRTLAVSVAVICPGLTALAQKVSQKEVPATVRKTFASAYPLVKTVRWEKEKGNYEASFMQSNNDMSALFTAEGRQLETELEIKTAALPAAILDYIKQNYSGYPIKEAAKITKAGGEVNFEAEVNGRDLLFDSSGKFINAVKD